MSDTTFQYKQTPITSAWLQDVNNFVYRDIGDTTNGKGADLVANATKKVTSIAALRALRVPQGSDAQAVILDGYYAAADGGGGRFVWNSTSTAADDGGMVIQPNSAPSAGRWLRADSQPVNVKWYGAKGDGTTDDTTAINNAIAALARGTVVFPAGTYRISSNITINAKELIFEPGAQLVPDVGVFVTLNSIIKAPDTKIFVTGKIVTACSIAASSNTLSTLKFYFKSGDAGQSICVVGAGPSGANLLTTVSTFTNSQSVTLAANASTALATNTSADGGIAYIGGGWVNVGNVTRTLNPVWWGLYDGSTGDSKALQACLMAPVKNGTSKVVFFPPGTASLDTTPIIDVNGLYLTALPGSATLLRAGGVPMNTFSLLNTSWRGRYGSESAGYPTISDLTVENLIWDGNQSGQSGTPSNDSYDEGLDLLYVQKANIRNNTVQNSVRIGISISTNCNDVILDRNRVYNCSEGGIYAEVSNNVRFIGNEVNNCSTSGYNIGAVCFNKISGGVIAGNRVYQGYDGIYIRNNSSDIAVSGNSISSTGRYGIWVFDESSGTANPSTTPTNISVTGNTIASPGSDAVHVSWASNVAVVGNAINASGAYAISLDHNTTARVGANAIKGSVTGDFNNGGGNSGLSINDISGTWTPSIQGATTAGTATYTSQVGRYSYNGNKIIFDAICTWSGHTGTGQMQMTLPVTSYSADKSILDAMAYNMTYTGASEGLVNGGTTNAGLWALSNGSLASIAVPASGTVYLSGAYEFQ